MKIIENKMNKVKLHRKMFNPLPDFKDFPIYEVEEYEIGDDELIKLFDRYFELKRREEKKNESN